MYKKHTERYVELTWDRVRLGITSLDNISKVKLKTINLIILIAKLAITKANYGKQRDPHLVFEDEMRVRKL